MSGWHEKSDADQCSCRTSLNTSVTTADIHNLFEPVSGVDVTCGCHCRLHPVQLLGIRQARVPVPFR